MPHVHNGLHHFTSVQSAYRKALGEPDPSFNGIERAGETITPVLNLWERPEWSLLRGERLWSVCPSVSATAAEFGQVGIRNPANSGVLCVVTYLNGFDTGGTQVIIEARIGAIATVDATASPMSRDTREINLTGGTGPLISLAHSSAARLGSLMAAWLSGANSGLSINFPVPFVLSPGFQLLVGPAVVNEPIQATLAGYWRHALSGELAV